MQSQSLNAFCADGTAEAPKPKPACSGWLPGNTDRPCKVVATGASSHSARRTTAAGGVTCTPAGEDAGTLGGAQQLDGARDPGLRFCLDLRRLGRGKNRQFTGLVGHQENVDRQFHEHRARLAAGRDPVGLEQHRHNLVMARDEKRCLGEPAHELMGVHLVQLIAMVGIGARPAADDQHRHAIEEGLANAAGGMGQPCGRNHGQHADGIRQPADGVRHECPAAFMRDKHLGNAVRHVQRVIQFRRMHARNAEREARADLFQRIDRKPGSGSFHVVLSGLVR